MFLSLEEELEKIELAYRFRRSAWGRGIATEASVVCLQFGFETLRLSEIIALAYPENAPSQRVLSKLGFEAAGRRLRLWQELAVVPASGRYIPEKITRRAGDPGCPPGREAGTA